MKNNRLLNYSLTMVILILASISFSLTSNAQTLYSCASPDGGSNPIFNIINPNNGATLSTTEITLPGETVRGCNGMAKHPETGVCYMMVNITPKGEGPVVSRVLAVIDPETGVARAIGDAQETFATLAFTSDGTLYGVTGDGGPTPETLFTINILNGIPTFVQTLGNGNDGEAIGFNPLDGLLYHASGNGTANVQEIFESINPNTNMVTPIPYSGDTDAITEIASLVKHSGNVFLAGDNFKLLSISTDGVVAFIGDMDHKSKGLAFDCVVPPIPPSTVPTISEWGLIAMAGILGIMGFMVLRRRKLTA